MGSRGVALGNSQTSEGHLPAASLKGLLSVEQSTESRPPWRSRGPYLLSLWPCLERAREVELGCSTPFFGCAYQVSLSRKDGGLWCRLEKCVLSLQRTRL